MKTAGDMQGLFKGQASSLGISFEYGSSERILNRQSSALEYPLLWVEKPTIRRLRSGGYKRSLAGGFTILIACQPDDYDAINRAQDDADLLTEKVLNRLEWAAEQGLFEFDRADCESDFLENWSADADTGLRTEFQLLTGTHCGNDSYWADAGWEDAAAFWTDMFAAYPD
jgi:hypothetical protein